MRFILGLALLFSFKAYTHEDFLDNSFEDLVLKEEIEETINFIEKDKIYFKEDFLKLSTNGIFLVLRSGKKIPIPNLYTGSIGIFSKIASSSQELFGFDWSIKNKCPVCKTDRLIGPCENIDCPTHQANQERMRQEKLKKEEKKQSKQKNY